MLNSFKLLFDSSGFSLAVTSIITNGRGEVIGSVADYKALSFDLGGPSPSS